MGSQVMEDALQWLRKGKADLSKIDSNVAEFVTSLLEKNQPNFENVDMDDKKIAALAAFAGLNLQPPTFSKEVKAKAIDDLLQSLKDKKLGVDDVNHSTLDLFSDLTGLEMPKGELTDEMKGSAMDEALKTIRDDRNELILSNLGNDSLAAPNLVAANEQLATKLENALDWVRNERAASNNDVEEKRKAMEDSLTWIRNNNPIIEDDPGEEIVRAMAKITGRPLPKKITKKSKKKFVEDSITWLRDNDPGRLDTVDDFAVKAITEFAGIPYQQKPLSADKKKSQAMDDALNWIRKNDPKVKDNPDEATITALSKLTGF